MNDNENEGKSIWKPLLMKKMYNRKEEWNIMKMKIMKNNMKEKIMYRNI